MVPRSKNDFETFLDHLVQSFPNNLQLQRALGLDVTKPYTSLGDIPWATTNDVRLDLAVNDYLLQISDERTIEVARRSDLLSRIRVNSNRMMVMNLIREAENDRVERALSASLKEDVIRFFPAYEEEMSLLQNELLLVLNQIEDEKNGS